jgi:serine/threonine protein kinase
MGGSDSKVQQVAQHRNYKIDKKLGSGGFGEVYLAKTTGGQQVAMKICKTARSAFNEAQILNMLSSPYIVKMPDCYSLQIESETFHALVLEYCERGDLANYLSKCTPSQWQRVIWCFELASGLEYIHSKGIAHRDIKPQNILVTIRGHVKLGDVGLAKAAYNLGVNINRYSCIPALSFEEYYMHAYVGTRPYMAPEVYNRHYQKHSDVFSLGLVFFVMAEGLDPIMPRTKQWQYLGKLLQESPTRAPATSLFSVPYNYATQFETRLFDNMLKFAYRERPTACQVVIYLKNMLGERNIPHPHQIVDVVQPNQDWSWMWWTLGVGAAAAAVGYTAVRSRR